MKIIWTIAGLLAIPTTLWASGQAATAAASLTGTLYGYMGIFIFVLAYCLVPLENTIHLRKSKPVLFAAGIIWVLLALAYVGIGST